MNTDAQPDLQGSAPKLLLQRETHDILACAFEVLNTLVLNFKHPRLEWERIVL